VNDQRDRDLDGKETGEQGGGDDQQPIVAGHRSIVACVPSRD
jgi:hypothetical protein